MDLQRKVIDYIENATEFDESLALEIVEFQRENIPFYNKLLEVCGVKRLNSLKDLPFFPVEFFKHHRLFIGKEEGYFESSGTTGNRSKVYFHGESLKLYEHSALKSFPFEVELIYSIVPNFEVANHSSLAYMIKIFEKKFRVEYLNDSFEISDIEDLLEKLKGCSENSLLFFTSSQLLRVVEYMKKRDLRILTPVIIVETGGYKALNRPYVRGELHSLTKKVFINALVYTEYGMTELFSQFYSTCEGLYMDKPYLKVFTEKEGLLKVFDFANLYTISALFVPDRINFKNDCFNVLGRFQEDERGCSFTFR